MSEPSGAGQLKGSMFLSTFAFIEHRFGPAAKETVLAKLSEEDRTLYAEILLPIAWYPLPAFGRLLRAMDSALGSGDLTLVTERGEWAATRDIRSLRRAVLKLLSNQWIIEKGASLWPQFHDTGRWQVRSVGTDQAQAELLDLATVDEAVCASIKGWIAGLAKLGGSRSVEVRHLRCRARGSATCVFDVHW
jgi:predicted hydrocarbon binding protein